MSFGLCHVVQERECLVLREKGLVEENGRRYVCLLVGEWMIVKKRKKLLGLVLERDHLVSREKDMVEENGCRDVWLLVGE